MCSSCGCGSGSVVVSAVSHHTPVRRKTRATTGPASGNQPAERVAASGGPTMKQSSSTMDSNE